jgi:hypothetical protein
MNGFRARLCCFHEVVDSRFQFFGRAVDAASQLALGEQCEPAFHKFNQLAEVGVKWTRKRERLASQF